jgi:hypothetical protein
VMQSMKGKQKARGAAVANSPWMMHVKQTRAANPGMSEFLKRA